MLSDSFREYNAFISSLNSEVDEQFSLHRPYIRCSKGCSACCIDFNLLPVEFFYIRQALEKEGFDIEKLRVANIDEGKCIFLKDNCCTIYSLRPYICRTHGLPLISMGDEEWELSACELNFTEADPEYFTLENCFMQDKANNRLFLINKEFLTSNEISEYSHFDMIPMRDFVDAKRF